MIRRGKKSDKQTALLALRKRNCAEYHATHDKCEVSHILDRCEEFRLWSRSHSLPGLELNHIFGRGTEKHESQSNYCIVERACHQFGHDVSPRAFELVCLYAKLMADSPDVEDDIALLESICGYASLVGRVEYLEAGQPPFFRNLASELLAFLRSGD